jgi:hypothetical protein
MGSKDQGSLHGSSDAGVTGKHGSVKQVELFVAPSTAQQLNTARLRLIPVACFRVDDIRFAFDSSFVSSDPADEKNDIRAELRLLVDLINKHPESPLSIFGHADPEGTDDYNKQLSGRRATVIYALLISNTDPATAVRLWQKVAAEENWGSAQRQSMQALTGLPPGTPDSGLFKAYMQKLSPPELQLGKKDFLGRGADPRGKADYQGCSEFNPLLIFSSKKQNDFDKQKDKAGRNDANAPNRRVMVLLFRKGSQVDPAKWPCPRATEGIAGCKKRFWSDGEQRRSARLPDKDRKYEETEDTFACRFYQRLLSNSPCEGSLPQLRIRLFDRDANVLAGAPCLITFGGKDPRPFRASGTAAQPAPLVPPASTKSPANATQGDQSDSGFIVLRDRDVGPIVNVKWSRPKAGDGPASPLPKRTDQFEFEMDLAIEIADDDSDKSAMTRLKNLGYLQGPIAPEDDIRAFQIEYKARFSDITTDGTLNPATKNAIKTVHDACDPVPKGPRSLTA